MEKRIGPFTVKSLMVCRHIPFNFEMEGVHVCDKCSKSLLLFDMEIPMGFNFSGISVLWLDKDKNFRGSLQKKGTQADTNDPDFLKALRDAISNGDIFKQKNLKIIYV